MLRAKPSTVFSSSTEPYASTRRFDFEMRIPPASPVSPASPRLVAILMGVLLLIRNAQCSSTIGCAARRSLRSSRIDGATPRAAHRHVSPRQTGQHGGREGCSLPQERAPQRCRRSPLRARKDEDRRPSTSGHILYLIALFRPNSGLPTDRN